MTALKIEFHSSRHLQSWILSYPQHITSPSRLPFTKLSNFYFLIMGEKEREHENMNVATRRGLHVDVEVREQLFTVIHSHSSPSTMG